MKPTAPPVKRGSPGTKGDRSSAIIRRSVGMKGSSAAVVVPDRSMRRADRPLRAKDEERIFSEEGIARDPLAALDALEQERVVGVLGDLEEGGDRRQQIRDDFLDDRHERAAPCQLHELFERLFANFIKGLDWAPPRKGPVAGRCPVHSSNCRSAWAMSISIPPIVSQPCARASSAARSGRRIDQIVDDPPSSATSAIGLPGFATLPAVVALTSRSQPGRSRRKLADVPLTVSAICLRRVAAGARRPSPRRPDRQAATRRRARRRLRPARRPRVPWRSDPARQRREETVDVGVRANPPPSRTISVLMAPTRAASGSISSTMRQQRHLERRRDARPAQVGGAREAHEVVHVARLERNVDRVHPECGKAGVVHHGRSRVHDRVADDGVERRVWSDAPELEILHQPHAASADPARRHLRRTSSGCQAAPRGCATPDPRCPSRSGCGCRRCLDGRSIPRDRTAESSPRGDRPARRASRLPRRSAAATRTGRRHRAARLESRAPTARCAGPRSR